MKHEYIAPKIELVKFNFDDQVVVASGWVGNQGSGDDIGRCQLASTTCSAYYTKPLSCTEWPPE